MANIVVCFCCSRVNRQGVGLWGFEFGEIISTFAADLYALLMGLLCMEFFMVRFALRYQFI